MADVRVSNGVRTVTDNDLVGLSIRGVIDEFTEFFNLDGGETVEVRSEGDDGYRTVNGNYLVEEGDSIRFARAAGTKG